MEKLYKKVDGILYEFTEQEYADAERAREELSVETPTLEERMAVVEENTQALKIILGVDN